MKDKRFLELMKETRMIKLQADEKSHIKDKLLSYIRESSKKEAIPTGHRAWSSIFAGFRMTMVKPVAIITILALVLVGGVSYAAQDSLPGDLLYPVKINVNEGVQGWLAFSNKSEADWYAELAARRLVEGEILASEGRLDTDVRVKIESRFEQHASDVEDRITRFESSAFGKAASVASRFEISLEAHDRILLNLGASTSAEVQVQLESLRSKVRERKEALAEYKKRLEFEHKEEVKGSTTNDNSNLEWDDDQGEDPSSTPTTFIKIEIQDEGVGKPDGRDDQDDTPVKIRGKVEVDLEL